MSHSSESSVRKLHRGEFFQRSVYCRFYGRITLIIWCQSLQCHSCHVTVCSAHDAPSAAGYFLRQNVVDQFFPGCLRFSDRCFRDLIIMAVKGDQSPYRSVNSLPYCLVEIGQRLQKIVSSYIGNIFSNGCKRQNCPGIFRIFFIMEYTFFLFHHIHKIGFITAVNRCVHRLAASHKADHHPFAAQRSVYRCAFFCHGCQMFSGFFINGIKTCRIGSRSCLCVSG